MKWAEKNGFKKGLQIDRIDNNKGYFPENCRFVSRGVNMRNTRRLNSRNTTGYRGVGKHGKDKFRASLQSNGKYMHIGIFSSAKEAAEAYDNFVINNNLEHTRNFKDNGEINEY